MNLRTDGFSESGGDAALNSRADTTSTSFTTLGVRPSFDVNLGSLDETLQGMLGWRHAFGDVNPSSTVSFAGSDTFTIEVAPVAKDMAVMDFGMGFNLTHDTTLAVTYGGQFSGDGIDQSVQGSLTITF